MEKRGQTHESGVTGDYFGDKIAATRNDPELGESPADMPYFTGNAQPTRGRRYAGGKIGRTVDGGHLQSDRGGYSAGKEGSHCRLAKIHWGLNAGQSTPTIRGIGTWCGEQTKRKTVKQGRVCDEMHEPWTRPASISKGVGRAIGTNMKDKWLSQGNGEGRKE